MGLDVGPSEIREKNRRCPHHSKLSSQRHYPPWLREIDIPSHSYANRSHALRAWARAKRPTPCSDWFTEKPFPEHDAHRLGEDFLATILHRKCSNQSVEVGIRRGLPPLRRCSAPGRSCFECVAPSSVHSSPKSTGLRGKIGMIRCVFLISTNVSVVSIIIVTEMIEKIHPRHFLNLFCKEKIEPFSAKNRSPAAVEVCLLKQPMTRLLDATVTPGDRYPWRLQSASDSEGDSEGDCGKRLSRFAC